MKKLALSILVATIFFPLPSHASKFLREVKTPLSRAFVPEGFDNDDSVEIVVTGKYPSTCYKMGAIETRVNAENEIRLSSNANEFSGNCLKGPIPFFQVVHLGRLREAGTYRIIDTESNALLGKIRIAAAPKSGHGTDEALYASLTDAYLLRDKERHVVRLVGSFPNGCLDFKKVSVQVASDVVVVLPELQTTDTQDCETGPIPFTKDVAIDRDLPHDQFLLHVRSMSGAAINKLDVSHP